MSHAWDLGSVPRMGHREEFLDNDPSWHALLTRPQRLGKWWRSASFGLALSGKAARAVGAAERAVYAAEAARDLVRVQAVYALLGEGLTVRQIADQLGLSKSLVGRLVKRASDDAAEGLPHPQEDSILRLVLESWQFANLATATSDHLRGTHEPTVSQGPTNFGGARQ